MKLERYDPLRHDPVTTYQAFLAGTLRMVHLGMWQDETAARAVLEWVWLNGGTPPDSAPQVCNLPWFRAKRLTGLLYRYRNSPYLLLTTLYPGRWEPIEFRELPFARDLYQQALTVQGIPMDASSTTRRRITVVLRARKLHRCYQCGDSLPLGQTSVVCPACQARTTATLRELRRHQIEQGLCVVPYCRNAPLPDIQKCEKHRSQERRISRRYRLRLLTISPNAKSPGRP